MHDAERAQRVRKGCTPSEVVYEEDRLKLLHYKTGVPVRHSTPLIFVFALVNRPYILDLKPGKKQFVKYSVTYKKRKVGPELNIEKKREPL